MDTAASTTMAFSAMPKAQSTPAPAALSTGGAVTPQRIAAMAVSQAVMALLVAAHLQPLLRLAPILSLSPLLVPLASRPLVPIRPQRLLDQQLRMAA